MNLFLTIFCIVNSITITYILTARRVSKIQSVKAEFVIDQIINELRKLFPEVSITKTEISFKDNSNNYPYDFESEEKFEEIIKNFDK